MKKGLTIGALTVLTIGLAWASLLMLSTQAVRGRVAGGSSGAFGVKETANDSLRSLHALVVPLDEASRQVQKDGHAVRGEIGKIAAILNQSSVRPLPPEVETFLQQQRPAIDQIRELLRTGPAPQWDRDDRALEKAPLPNLLEVMFVEKLLAADASSAEKSGDHERAWQTMQAQWVLARSMWSRPELISNLIALASTKLINAAARKLPAPAPVWWREVEGLDVDGHFHATVEYEKWLMTERVETDRQERPLQRLRNLLLAPIERYQLSRALDYYDALGRIPLDCRQSEPAARPDRNFLTRWKLEYWTTGLGDVRSRFARFLLERELSSKVLASKEARRINQPPPDESVSRCGSWKTTTVDGRTTIQYIGTVPRVDSPITPMPLELTF